MQQNVDLSNSTPYVCESCGHDVFETAYKLRQIPGIASPSGEAMLVPVQVFSCKHCSHINEEFLPPDEKSNLTLV